LLRIIAAFLIALWLVRIVTSTTLGGFIHMLPLLAVVAYMIGLFRSRPEDASHSHLFGQH